MFAKEERELLNKIGFPNLRLTMQMMTFMLIWKFGWVTFSLQSLDENYMPNKGPYLRGDSGRWQTFKL